ncbi:MULTISPECIES: WYL domain-containing protein [unclassified Paenibacillus]|uniref:helix-turn-helix transcriptional regulator n=1 Tax=unclassified Paenibacillus TaxID=185978 RepID=UPI0009541240|nr:MULTISPECIES: WYL domain-containing protein [unclassified Paenibacillus]ASS67997.1 WYL domain-containing protein [Paenibacillus sp. RUD330]SIR41916.1 Predicted DNA-binding transcriptional regulator YafY, contains an HTH and WYL domains [Paenibacillus sp. RU4X]SIR52074.1 Predicted DNA-binding transcriptional regulator YafY, contains an HTH and WYL domains [Paenibacillus sp. RU4T]
MNRNDRLIALLIALQRNSYTAAQLAERFEVSERTILRDMQSLSEMGVPLYSATGPGGGFRLMDGYRLPPLQLDAQEALTALFALHAVTRFGDSPFNRERWTVLDKIRALLPEETLRQVEPILGKMHLEVPRRSVRSPMLPLLLELLAESRTLRTLYRSQTSRRWLELQPVRVYAAHGFWYCEAFSPLHGEVRTFRVDRMEELQPLEEGSEAGSLGEPDCREASRGAEASAGAGGGAGGATASVVGRAIRGGQAGDDASSSGAPAGNSAGSRSSMPAAACPAGSAVPVAVRLTYRGSLLAEQDEHIGELVEQAGDEEWELRFDCPAGEWTWAVRFFYGMGLDAEVLSPPELRAAVASMAASVLERYNEDSDRGCS